jgi:hypothetical protein
MKLNKVLTHSLKSKIFSFLLILTSLMGYLEWGKGHQMFLFQAEGEIFAKLFNQPGNVLHPFILFPFIGQLLLALTLFQKQPGKVLTFTAIAGIGILILMMLVIGCMGLNFKIALSTIPYLLIATFTILHHLKKK